MQPGDLPRPSSTQETSQKGAARESTRCVRARERERASVCLVSARVCVLRSASASQQATLSGCGSSCCKVRWQGLPPAARRSHARTWFLNLAADSTPLLRSRGLSATNLSRTADACLSAVLCGLTCVVVAKRLLPELRPASPHSTAAFPAHASAACENRYRCTSKPRPLTAVGVVIAGVHSLAVIHHNRVLCERRHALGFVCASRGLYAGAVRTQACALGAGTHRTDSCMVLQTLQAVPAKRAPAQRTV